MQKNQSVNWQCALNPNAQNAFYLRFCEKEGKPGRYLIMEDLEGFVQNPRDVFFCLSIMECQIVWGAIRTSYIRAGLAVPEMEILRVNCETGEQEVLPIFRTQSTHLPEES